MTTLVKTGHRTFGSGQDHGSRGNSYFRDKYGRDTATGHLRTELSDLGLPGSGVPANLARLVGNAPIEANIDSPTARFTADRSAEELDTLRHYAEQWLVVHAAELERDALALNDDGELITDTRATHILRPEELGIPTRASMRRRPTKLDPEDFEDATDEWAGYTIRDYP